jgi:hypothetical protein
MLHEIYAKYFGTLFVLFCIKLDNISNTLKYEAL